MDDSASHPLRGDLPQQGLTTIEMEVDLARRVQIGDCGEVLVFAIVPVTILAVSLVLVPAGAPRGRHRSGYRVRAQ